MVVNGSEFDIVNGYFKSINSNTTISGNLTSALFTISNQTKIPVMTLLGFIKGKSTFEMNKVLAYYLNSFKSKTTLYGVGVTPQANQPAARNIVV